MLLILHNLSDHLSKDQHVKTCVPKNIKMTDLINLKNKKDLFQKLKMADKVITLTMKSLKENINRKDIKKAVVDLKDIVDELEHISKETDINIDKDKDEKNPTKRKIYL